MPNLQVFTNVSKDKVSAKCLTELSQTVAKILGKPESYCVVHVIPDQLMTFAGTADPCATATLSSIGKLGPEENISHAAILYEVIERYIGVPGDRMYITFNDVERSNAGYNGTTFHGLAKR